MQRIYLTIISLIAVSLSAIGTVNAQNNKNKFTVIKENKITSIKDQANSGTCWSYSANAFLESELLRMGKGDIDLSEMFVVSHCYRDKGDKYVRLHGKLNYAQGGSFYDILAVFKDYGAVPESYMRGLNYGTTRNAHNELEKSSHAFLDAIVKNPNGKLSTAWKPAFNNIIDSYLGEIPTEFEYKGVMYTPKSFAEMLGINPDDYVSLTSYTHHPFYAPFALEIEDNWRWALSYNLPIEEFMNVMDNAINKGYTVAWGSDVSEVGFNRYGLGILADFEAMESEGSDQARWVGLSRSDKAAEMRARILEPDCPEIDPTQEYRQMGYDNYQLTDDHGMLIYGKAKNQVGKEFYMVKNSWGETGEYKGIWYVSRNFVQGRTMNIIVHKNALPKAIAKKLGLK